MDFLECKICNTPYDEEDHRPRQVPCGHGLCSVCLRALIKEGIFECPKCKQKIKLDVPDNLPVNYDLIEVVRAFKSKDFYLVNDEICNIHYKSISHWCYNCQIWICIDCLESHSKSFGCSTAMLTNAIKTIKDEQIGSLNSLLTKFDDDTKQVSLNIQEHADKRKELLKWAEIHSEEQKKLHDILEKGSIHRAELVESRRKLYGANSPNAIGNCIKLVTQRKQLLHSWSIKNLENYNQLDFKIKNLENYNQLDFKEALKEGKKVYVECIIKNEKTHGKLDLHQEMIYFHKLMKQTPTHGCVLVPFDSLQKLIPASGSLVFLEMNLGGTNKGHVFIQLNKNIPNIRENMITIVTGRSGKSLAGIKLDDCNSLVKAIRSTTLPFSEMEVIPDSNGKTKANKGDVVGWYPNGYLQEIIFCFGTHDWIIGNTVIGSIVAGMDIIQKCYDNHNLGVLITDCGLILELD